MKESKQIIVTNHKTGRIDNVTRERWEEFKKNNEWHPEFNITYSIKIVINETIN